MEEFAKKKGKELTRGSKQIAKENAETIYFYRDRFYRTPFWPEILVQIIS
jgi:hypothetical protein